MSVPGPKAKKLKRTETGTELEDPILPDGEDTMSYQRHVKCLKNEWAKRHPNGTFVAQLMEMSYGHRRHWILAESRLAGDILEECPFLSTFEHVSTFVVI